ncbi:MAG: META domain-containing protein [Hyphomicrobiaceae bacterium]
MRAWGWAMAAAVMLAAAPMAEAADPVMSLAGSEWGFASETGEHQRFVQFSQEGLLSGHGGCNHFGGGYTQKDAELTIEGLISTRMACAADVMTAEDAFLRALEASHHIEATHTALKIFGADGAVLLDLVRRDAD